MRSPFVYVVLTVCVMAILPFPTRAEGMRAYAEVAVKLLRSAGQQRSAAGYFWEQISNETIEKARFPNQDAVVETFIARIKAKDAKAMFWLGNAYRDGRILPAKNDEAIRWYEAAASKDDAEAAGALYWLYKGNSGVLADYAKAYQWSREAIRLGEANAQLEQVVFRTSPETTTFTTLIADLTQAAKAGDADAQYTLCLMENRSIGMTRNRTRARELCGQAAAQGHLEALARHALLLSDNGVYGPETLAELLTAAKRGLPLAQYGYAMATYDEASRGGKAEGGDSTTPYDWMEKAAEQNYAEAQLMTCALAITASVGDIDYARVRLGYKWCYVVDVIPYYRYRVAAEKYYAGIESPGRHFLPFDADEAKAAEASARTWRAAHPM